MIMEIQKFSARQDLEHVDMCVVAVMSHGRHGLVAAADGRELETEWVLRQFNNEGCPQLRGNQSSSSSNLVAGTRLTTGSCQRSTGTCSEVPGTLSVSARCSWRTPTVSRSERCWILWPRSSSSLKVKMEPNNHVLMKLGTSTRNSTLILRLLQRNIKMFLCDFVTQTYFCNFLSSK